jgi:hypothetical protein
MAVETWNVEEKREDLFAVRWRFVNEAVIEWEIHEIAGYFDDGKPVYADERHDNSMQAFEHPSHTPIDGGHILHGDLKFDRCCNIQQSNTDCMMHFCEPTDEPMLSKMMRAVYALGPQMRGWS